MNTHTVKMPEKAHKVLSECSQEDSEFLPLDQDLKWAVHLHTELAVEKKIGRNKIYLYNLLYEEVQDIRYFLLTWQEKENGEGDEKDTVYLAVDKAVSRLDEALVSLKTELTRPKKGGAQWRELPNEELKQYLLENKNISDRAWADRDEVRSEGETRNMFINRVFTERMSV